jgi:hypothetical protein
MTVTDTLRLHEAAVRCGVSDETIRRRLKAGQLPNAISSSDGWEIPLMDLIRAGLEPRSPRAVQAEQATTGRSHLGSSEAEALLAARDSQIETLERLVEAQERHINDLRIRLTQEATS